MATKQIAALRERLTELKLASQVATLEADVRSAEMVNRYLEDEWGSTVDRRDAFADTSWGPVSRISQPDDRKHGDNRPFWQTEQQTAEIRGIARFLAGSDGIGIAALNNLCNYTIGDGLQFQFSPKQQYDGDVEVRKLAALCQVLVEHFSDQNQFYGDGDRHGVERNHRDGELTSVLYHRGGPDVELRWADPSCMTQPDNPQSLERYLGLDSLEWKYGVATDWGNPCRVHGYFMLWEGDRNDWEFVTPERMFHLKLNVDREVKRGASDFYPIYQELENVAKLAGNTVRGAAIQAAIAYIREHAPSVGANKIRDWVGTKANQVTTASFPGGRTETKRARQAVAGTVVDVMNGAKYHAGPMGQQRSTVYVEIMQAAYRRLGSRWNMPEYMISGDASNANFSSTLVAESPFVVNTCNRQAYYKRSYSSLAWKVLGLIYAATSILPLPVSRIRQLVTLTITAPDVAIRDRLKEAQANKIEADGGILSRDTWATRSGLRLKDEEAKGAKPLPVFSPKDQVDKDGNPIQLPGTDPKPKTAIESIPVAERVSLAKGLLWGSYP